MKKLLFAIVFALIYMGANAQKIDDIKGRSGEPTLRQELNNRYTRTQADNLLSAKEPLLGNPAANGYILSSSSAGLRSWITSTNWNTAYTDRLKWDGGATGLTASTGRTSLGATTVGSNLFTLTNPSAISFLRLNADNTVSALSTSAYKTSLSLDQVNNTSDVNKPISSATQAALDGKFSIVDGVSASDTYQKKSFETELTLTDAATVTWDASVSRNATLTLGGNRTLSISNPVSGVMYRLLVKQDATGSRTLTFPSNVIWQGAKPPLSTAGQSTDKILLTYDGSKFYAELVKDFRTDLTAGAVVVYEADEASGTTAVAATGTNGTLMNGTLVNQTGKLNKAWSFDGTNDYINTNISSDGITTAFTLSVWINPTAPASADAYILSRTTASYQIGRSIYLSPTQFKFTDQGLTPDTYSASYTASVWTHFVVVYDGSSIEIYKNGVSAGKTNCTGTLATPSTNWIIGCPGFLGSNYYIGLIDQVSIFNTAKTAAEIAQIYNSGTGKLYALWSTSPLPGTKTYYVSDSSSGTVNRKLTFKDGLLISEQ